MIILINPWLFKLMKYPPRAMALFPFVLIKRKEDKFDNELLNHEKIHLYQQLELLILPFYVLYLGHYFVQRLRYKEHYKAYMNIVFEREAYENDSQLSYLRERKLWAFWKYWNK